MAHTPSSNERHHANNQAKRKWDLKVLMHPIKHAVFNVKRQTIGCRALIAGKSDSEAMFVNSTHICSP